MRPAAITDEDRALLRDLRRLSDAMGPFCVDVLEGTLHDDAAGAMAERLDDLAERVRRARRHVLVLDAEPERS